MRQGFTGKVSVTVATLGWRDGCLYALSRVLHSLSGTWVRLIKYRFVVQPIDVKTVANQVDSKPRATGTFALGEVGPDSRLFAQIERPPAVIARRFAQGAHCLAATAGESQLAGFLWYVVGPYDEDEVRARFVPGPEGRAAWDFDVSILPKYRMGRLFNYLWRRAFSDLAARGVEHSISRISAFNAASIASHERLGAQMIGSASFLCVGRVQLMWSSCRPRIHLSWRDEQRPLIRIEAPNAARST